MLTAQRLKEVVLYHPQTGEFTWRMSRGRSVRCLSGAIAGSVNTRGYARVCIDRKTYAAHRLVWLYVYGEWPPAEVDHINLVKSDNRVENLRLANRSENQGNTALSKSNSSGFKGVSFAKDKGKWRAIIKKNGRRKHLGYFSAPEDASVAYAEAAREIFGEFAR